MSEQIIYGCGGPHTTPQVGLRGIVFGGHNPPEELHVGPLVVNVGAKKLIEPVEVIQAVLFLEQH